MRRWRTQSPLSPVPAPQQSFALRRRSSGEALMAGVENNWEANSRPSAPMMLLRMPLLMMDRGISLLFLREGFSVGTLYLRFPGRGFGKAPPLDPTWFDDAELVVLEMAPAGVVTRRLTMTDLWCRQIRHSNISRSHVEGTMKPYQVALGGCAVPCLGVIESYCAGTAPGPPPRDTAQRQPTGTGRIRGSCRRGPDQRSAAPRADDPAVVRQSGDPAPCADRRARTLRIHGVPVGKFVLVASAPGYVGLQYGQRRPDESGTPIQLRDGETAASIDFALPRGSMITGRVIDEFGQPLVQAQVQARRFRYTETGSRSLFPVTSDATDDRGEFRLFGLMPGEVRR